MNDFVSVILPTHAPHPRRLARTLEGLRRQDWPTDCWELLLVDNASPEPAFLSSLDLSWQPQAQVIREPRLGLTYARLAGIATAGGSLLVFVDDDNVLAPDYLRQAVAAFTEQSSLGALGGKSLPEWEKLPAAWVHEFNSCLCFAISAMRTVPLALPTMLVIPPSPLSERVWFSAEGLPRTTPGRLRRAGSLY